MSEASRFAPLGFAVVPGRLDLLNPNPSIIAAERDEYFAHSQKLERMVSSIGAPLYIRHLFVLPGGREDTKEKSRPVQNGANLLRAIGPLTANIGGMWQ